MKTGYHVEILSDVDSSKLQENVANYLNSLKAINRSTDVHNILYSTTIMGGSPFYTVMIVYFNNPKQ